MSEKKDYIAENTANGTKHHFTKSEWEKLQKRKGWENFKLIKEPAPTPPEVTKLNEPEVTQEETKVEKVEKATTTKNKSANERKNGKK